MFLPLVMALSAATATMLRAGTGREVFISLSDRRMVIKEGDQVVASYPVAIGRPGHPTPTGEFTVIDVDDKPTGAPAVSARWMGFLRTTNKDGRVEFGIHGTQRTKTIGTRASHGCIRLRNQDAVEAFRLVGVGDRVHIFGMPHDQSAGSGATGRTRRQATSKRRPSASSP
jgi:lipoprotein-anchoring transpeptidase ErfK/SrfK